MKVRRRLPNYFWCIIFLRSVQTSIINDLQKNGTDGSRKGVKYYDDNLAESSLASYSAIVIHHPSTKPSRSTSQWAISDHRKIANASTVWKNLLDGDFIKDETGTQGSRSESYFKIFKNGTSKQKRPSMFISAEKTRIQQVESPLHKQAYNSLSPIPGMTHTLMNPLLKQQPQTFRGDLPNHVEATTGAESWANVDILKSTDTYGKALQLDSDKTPKNNPEQGEKLKKRPAKPTRGDQGSSFNVGYSIGFGINGKSRDTLQAKVHKPSIAINHRDIVLGKPKAEALTLNVQGPNSVWKEIQAGIEMSQNVIPKQIESMQKGPDGSYRHRAYKISSEAPQIELLGDGQQGSVFYLDGLNRPDINTISTAGQSTFDHAHALGQSNAFDFSNAMSNPEAIVLREQDLHQHLSRKNYLTKPANLDSPLQESFGSPPFAADNGYSKTPVFAQSKSPSFHPPQTDSLVVTTPPSAYKTIPAAVDNYNPPSEYGRHSPVPIHNVFIPATQQAEGRMVQAIVIPINQIRGFNRAHSGFNLAGLAVVNTPVGDVYDQFYTQVEGHEQLHGHHLLSHQGQQVLADPSIDQWSSPLQPGRGYGAKTRAKGPDAVETQHEGTKAGHSHLGTLPMTFLRHHRTSKTPLHHYREHFLIGAVHQPQVIRKVQLTRGINRPPSLQSPHTLAHY